MRKSFDTIVRAALLTILSLLFLLGAGVGGYALIDSLARRKVERLYSIESTPLGADDFDPVEMLPRPPIVRDFPVLAAEVASRELADDQLVLAVAINGEARAYPLDVMTGPHREVFNDELGGVPIAATW